MQINPQEIRGNWQAGYALDVHTKSSQLLPDGEFDTEYTNTGRMVNQVKYQLVQSKIQPLAEIAAKFVKEEFAVDGHIALPYISAIIPIPPSVTSRPFQPVLEIAKKIGSLLHKPVCTDYLIKVRSTRLVKNLQYDEKQAEIQGAFDVQSQGFKERGVLLFDDLYDSGSTLAEATYVLYEHARVSHVLVLTLTKTRTGRNPNYDSIPINAYPNDEEKMDIEKDFIWFRLFKTRGIGAKSLTSIAMILEKKNLSPEILLSSQHDVIMQHPELAKYSSKTIEVDEEKVLAEYELLKDSNVEIIHPRHPDFPPNPLKIAPMLFIKGKRKLLTANGVAIVGSRNVSDTSTRIARQLAGNLAKMDFNVVSGYAKGVDYEAHFGALSEGGTTTIVLPYGIRELRQRSGLKEFDWQKNILAVSQFDPEDRWKEHNAMIRNQLICALSKAVVVVESGPKRDAQGKMSGTFNTALTALDMKRPLFVMDPKRFDNPPMGNADLIKLGGERFDPVDGADKIISAAKTELFPVKKQDSHEQLNFL